MTTAEFTIDRVTTAALRIVEGETDFERDHADAIQSHWEQASNHNPHLFDGRVHLCSAATIQRHHLEATCHAVRFATLMYWRKLWSERGHAGGLRNTFGDVILRGWDGGILVGRRAAHTANAGRICLPGGSFDGSDVRDGQIDPNGCILRECAEETGFEPADYVLDPELLVYRDPRCVAYGRVAMLPIPAIEARNRAMAFIASESEPELEDILVVSSIADTERLIPDTYEHHLIAHVFQETPS